MNPEFASDARIDHPSMLRCLLHGVLGVVQFELRRWLLPSRLIFGTALTCIPLALMVISYVHLSGVIQASANQVNLGSSIAVFVMVPQMISMLGLLLWGTPVINSELESQTWIYSVSRPMGRISMLIGKYLVAVAWTTVCCLIVLSVGGFFTMVSDRLAFFWTMIRLAMLANLAYGALYVLIGTLMQRRSMVVAFVFTLVVEVGLTNVPAIINRFTVGFRLRSLLFVWEDLPIQGTELATSYFIDTTGAWHHVGALLLYTVVLLSLSVTRVWWGEYPLQPESA